MLKRFSWNKNDLHIIHLKKNMYTIAQLLVSPYAAFFNILSESDNFDGKTDDLGIYKPFGVCQVLKDFFRKTSVGKIRNIRPNLTIPVPEIFISKDKGQWGDSDIKDDQKIYNLVRIDPLIGDKGIMGNKIIQYNINKNDPNIINKYEITGYNTGYEFVRRLIISFENNKWIDPLKEKHLLGLDNYPLKTVEEMWDYGVPKYI